MDVRLPDGRILTGVPDGTTKAQLSEKLKANGVSFNEQQENGNDAGAGNAFAYGLAGAVPFGNVITSGIGAGIAKAGGAEGSFSDLYDQAQADTKITQENSPLASLAGNAVGFIEQLPIASSRAIIGNIPKTGIRGAINEIPQALSKVGNYVRGGKVAEDAGALAKLGNAVLQGGRAAIVAAPTGALFGAGDAEEGHRLQGAVRGAGLASGVSAALPIAGAALSIPASAAVNKLVPKVDEGLFDAVSLAKKYNIPVSLDQATNSRPLKNIQKVSQEVPFSGQSGFREKQLGSFNRALLSTVGQEGERITPRIMDKAFKDVGAEFDSLGRGKVFTLDDDFARSLDNIREEAKSFATKDAIDNFENAVVSVMKNADQQGNITGEALGFLRARTNALSRKANSPDTQELLRDLENALIDKMTAGDDLAKGTLSSAKQKYKNLLAIEPLAAKSKGGNISPSLLAARVSKIYGREYTRGKAGEIGDLARVGAELLPELGGSDTLQKGAYLGSLVAGASNPASIPWQVGFMSSNAAYQKLFNRNPKLVDKAIMKHVMSLPPEEARSLGLIK